MDEVEIGNDDIKVSERDGAAKEVPNAADDYYGVTPRPEENLTKNKHQLQIRKGLKTETKNRNPKLTS